jgi:hypothetical protein
MPTHPPAGTRKDRFRMLPHLTATRTIPAPTRRTVAYMRVSTEEQALEGYSLPDQVRRARAADLTPEDGDDLARGLRDPVIREALDWLGPLDIQTTLWVVRELERVHQRRQEELLKTYAGDYARRPAPTPSAPGHHWGGPPGPPTAPLSAPPALDRAAVPCGRRWRRPLWRHPPGDVAARTCAKLEDAACRFVLSTAMPTAPVTPPPPVIQ